MSLLEELLNLRLGPGPCAYRSRKGGHSSHPVLPPGRGHRRPRSNHISSHITLLHSFLLLSILSQLPRVTCDRQAAPYFVVQPTFSGGIVTEGQNKILQCQAVGFPAPEYRWFKDGQPLNDYSRDPLLRMNLIVAKNSGSYQCVAKNAAGAIFSQKTELTVAYMMPLEEVNNVTLVVRQGHAALVQPPLVDSIPKATVHWEKLGYGRLHDRKYFMTSGNALVVLNAEKGDAGFYKVVFTNTQVGKEVTAGFAELIYEDGYLSKAENPLIVVPPRNTTFQQGAFPAVLQCVVNARPLEDLQLEWTKDGIPISQSGLAHFLSPWNRTLTLLNVLPTHAGIYQCLAYLRPFPERAISSSATVQIHVEPAIVGAPSSETVSEIGNQVILPCNVSGFPAPKVSWFRNAVSVGLEPEDRYQVLSNGSLSVSPLSLSDSGIFQCLAENLVGEATANTWLHVTTAAPALLLPPQDLTILDGRDAQFPCTASGAPKPSLSWTLNGSLPVHSAGRFQILEDGSLVLQSVEPKDTGTYTCSRSNSAGTVTASAFLSILVRTQIVGPPVDTKVILGTTAEMQCLVSHDPSVPIQVNWHFGDQNAKDRPGGRFKVMEDGSLQVFQARNTDAGLYTCRVTSAGGNESRSAKLNVIELPHQPANVRATLLDTFPKTVNLSWSKAFDGNSPITQYIVQMRLVPTPGSASLAMASESVNSQLMDPLAVWILAQANISGEERWIVLNHLKPSSSYQFRVSAINGVGEGIPSFPTEIVALPAEPPSHPTGLVGGSRSATSIMLQWQPPPEEDVSGYLIRYKLAGYSASPWAYQNITNMKHHNYLLEDLIVWQRYEIQVAAYNQMGVGAYSDFLYLRTREGVPQSSPTNVRALPLSSTSVRVWWTPPDPQLINGINLGYKVELWLGDPEALEGRLLAKQASISPSPTDQMMEQSAEVSELNPFTLYNVTVLCFTSPGDGPRSKSVAVITDQDFPGEVGSLTFEEILDTVVKVSWTAPKKANGIIQGYTLSYFAKDRPEELVNKSLLAKTDTFQVVGLKPTTAYVFGLQAFTSVGLGPSRTATIQSGIPPVLPGAPTRLAVSNIHPFSVVLQFMPGFDGNTSITKWTVEAGNRRRNDSSWFKVDEIQDPEATSLKVSNLVPFTEYRLRLIASNVVGPSPPSEPTKLFQTIQAPPSHPPYNVTVRAVNANALRVRWTPLLQVEWFGVPRGYNISFRAVRQFLSPSSNNSSLPTEEDANRTKKEEVQAPKYQWRILEDHNANSFVLDDLEEFTVYTIFVKAFNDVGSSDPSGLAIERTRESTPFMGPPLVSANATSSTTIVVHWNEIEPSHQNGIIEGYKVYYGAKTVPFQLKTIEGNQTFTSTLIELKKYTLYSVQVLGYTRIGDGALSLPPISIQTLEDVPGVPSNVSFPDVTTTTARIIWDVPKESNGQILAYKVSYGQNKTGEGSVVKELPPTSRTLKTFNLEPETYYLFSVTAQTREGWGLPGSALVFTTNKRDAPQPPSAPSISLSQIQARQITFSWTPGRDGFAPLRYYTIQMSEEEGPFRTLPHQLDPYTNLHTAAGLKPYTFYQFRLQATNDIGASGWSLESKATRTLPAAPAEKPSKVTVTPYTTTSVTVQWEPLVEPLWNGDILNPGYRVQYCLVSAYTVSQSLDCPSERVLGIHSSSVSLQHLEQDRMYEIKVIAFNSQGEGPSSIPVSVYVGEAVPTGPPNHLEVSTLSSTEIRVSYQAPSEKEKNGELLGYKIFYQSEHKGSSEELEVVSASTTSYVLMDLLKFRDYRVQVLAFNPAGDGPRSPVQLVKTLEDLPGAPGPLIFSDVTMTNLNISWALPINPNGVIRGYLITYETALPDTDFLVKQKVTTPFLSVRGLREQIAYTFTVRAETIGLGPPSIANITTGPQAGSPGSPLDLHLQTTHTSVTMLWRNGASGASPLTGYLVEARESDSAEWQTLVQLNQGPQQAYTISYQNLLPSKNYAFRLFSCNKFGISYPAENAQPVATPSKMYLEFKQKMPFYREVWFLVMLASATVIIIILVVAVLCVKSKAYKYKHEAQKTLHDDRISMDDGGFATFELRQSKRGTLCKNTLSRKSANSVLAKSPPRPSPASITYSDEEDTKGYDDNCDSSSLTEKPSEISSTDSQATDSDRESTKSDPHSFVNHYANVNETFRHSWKRQRPHVKPPSYTSPSLEMDSEPEGSLAVSLNGGHIIMNNLAGSRAPLPGFSSFV